MPEAECYAKANLPVHVNICRIMARFRDDCLPLQVELGRFLCQRLLSRKDYAICTDKKSKPKSIFYCIVIGKSQASFPSHENPSNIYFILNTPHHIYSIAKLSTLYVHAKAHFIFRQHESSTRMFLYHITIL